ncbi:GNAT family N-acetyltransferase [Marinimicrobium locisalis]|uniref:GNAT family N-acetyltransferase n=1 Tax=Marinimicrobium locisalis TaxID=546022 RepID=UPI003221C29B
MAEHLTIEPLTPDTPRLEHWLSLIGQWHHEHCLARGLHSSLERRIEQIRKHLSHDPLPVTLVAHKAGQPLGSVSLLRYLAAGTGNRLWLSNLYVESSVRNRGLGQALMEHACRYAKAQGERELWLFTDDQRAFYRKRGWRPAGDARISRTEVDILVRVL